MWRMTLLTDLSMPIVMGILLGGCTKPDMVSKRVDLPDPLAPIIATISPGLIDRDTSHRAWKLP